MKHTRVGAALLLVAAVGCTTSFDLGALPRRDGGADLPAVFDADCEGGACEACPPSLTRCGGACVDTRVSPAHCGGCDQRCGDGFECVDGRCAVQCPAPLVACGARCANTAVDTAHCGACDRPCDPANALARCASGACERGDCANGFGDCDGVATNGCEAVLATSAAHCGRCGNACQLPNAAASACVDGRCAVGRCADGFGDCDGVAANGCETDTRADPWNCGACARMCPSAGGVPTCRAGACGLSTTQCPSGRADCDGNGTCETDTTRPESCGRCGNACAVPHATASCASTIAGYRCGVARCDAGFADCDTDPVNGCEADTRNDPRRCGACTNACAVPGGAAGCVNGACTVASCDPDRADCDRDPRNGCEVSVVDSATNCGACGVACAASHATTACREGRCAITACDTGRADCNGNPADGCEVDTRASAQHCGLCGNACALPNATAVCDHGACAVDRCAAGYGDCDGAPANGCEAALATSSAHCGGCGRACPSGESCVAGRCAPVPCPPGSTRCAGACVDLQTDPAYCGACDNRCAATPNATSTCVAGRCASTCASGFADCDGRASNGCEASLATSAADCGACGRACAPGTNETATCTAGVCTRACTAPYDRCGTTGCTVNLRTTAAHCGRCGNACPAAATRVAHGTSAGLCVDGRCTLICDATWGDCNRDPGDGCEADLLCDRRNCGTCARSCEGTPSGDVCCGGVCGVTIACSLASSRCR